MNMKKENKGTEIARFYLGLRKLVYDSEGTAVGM
jgi:hypothetical protein